MVVQHWASRHRVMSLLCVALVAVLVIAHGLGASAEHHATSAAGRSDSSTRPLLPPSHRLLGTRTESFADDATDVTLRCEDRQTVDPADAGDVTVEGGDTTSTALGRSSEASISACDLQYSDARVRGPSVPARR